MIVDANRFGAGPQAAEIAAILTERGLGGDGADLDARLDQFRRDRSQRAGSARDWRGAGRSKSPQPRSRKARAISPPA